MKKVIFLISFMTVFLPLKAQLLDSVSVQGRKYSMDDFLSVLNAQNNAKNVTYVSQAFSGREERGKKRLERMFSYNSFEPHNIDLFDSLDVNLHPIVLSEDIPNLSVEERNLMGVEKYFTLCYKNLFKRFSKNYPDITKNILSIIESKSYSMNPSSPKKPGGYMWTFDEINIDTTFNKSFLFLLNGMKPHIN